MNKLIAGVVLSAGLGSAPLTAQGVPVSYDVSKESGKISYVDGIAVRRLNTGLTSADLDSPAINVRLTFYLIQASDAPMAEDAEIRPIVVELRKIFKFQGYKLASKSVLQAAPPGQGQTVVRQIVNDPDGESFMIEAYVGANSDGLSAFTAVRLYRPPFPSSNGTGPRGEPLIDASVNVKDGKMVVLGSALGGKDRAIILAVSPTIEK
jgi:hypothetical protein